MRPTNLTKVALTGLTVAAIAAGQLPSAAASTGRTFVSDLGALQAVNGYGPVEKDRSNAEWRAGDGRTITLAGTTFPKGLGVHAPSDVRYTVPAGCTTFTSTVGVDDEVGAAGSVVFQVFNGTQKLYDSGTRTGASANLAVSVPVTAGAQLRLVVTDAGNGAASDHADWANAGFVCGITTAAPAPAPTAPAGRVFPAGRAFWDPIVTSPRLDPTSAAVSARLADPLAQRVALTAAYANPVYNADASTPRYKVTVLNAGTDKWGDNDLAHQTVPIPADAVPGTGGDGKVIVVDWSTRKVYDMWQVKRTTTGWTVAWGGVYPLDGDGSSHNAMYTDVRNPKPYTVAWPQPVSRATGSGISSLAGSVRLEEMAAGVIPHALVFASDISCGPANSGPYRWPATTTDGYRVGETCIPQGARVQLDPTIDLTKIPGITKAELAVGRALQTYGAYNTDVGGSRMSFGFERPRAGQPNPYTAAGMTIDYFSFSKLPWKSMRVLNSWNGA